jgi:hypothetical protein
MEIAQSAALFLHILGGFGLAVANGLELIVLRGVRRGGSGQIAVWSEPYRLLPALGGGSVAVLLLTGLYMMATDQGAQPWILMGLIAVAVIAVIGAWSGIPLRRAMLAALAAPGDEAAFGALLDWRFAFSNRLRIALLVGVLGLMVFKTDWVGSLIITVVAAGAGLAWAAMALSPRSGAPTTSPAAR